MIQTQVTNPAQPSYPPPSTVVPFPPSAILAPGASRGLHGGTQPKPLSLEPTLRPSTAPGPRSAPPTAFFDNLQVEDLRRRRSLSDESDTGAMSVPTADARTRVISTTSSATARPIGHGQPKISSSFAYLSASPTAVTIPFDALDPTKPLTNTPSPSPQSGSFFSQLRLNRTNSTRSVPPPKGGAKRIPESAFEFMSLQTQAEQGLGGVVDASYSDERLPASGSSQNRLISAWTGEQAMINPSIRKLDGLLTQHIEAEKDTMRRIAFNQR